jgi:hypoxanthine phosphoribosyltransferase
MHKIHITQQEIQGLTLDLLRQMQRDQWLPHYVVGLTRGGLVPANLISQYLDVPMHTLRVSLRDGGDRDCESNLWMAEDAFGYVPHEQQKIISSRWDPSFKRNILIVDDINDTGATLDWIRQDWQSSCLPSETNAWSRVWNHNVRFAVLIDNLASNCGVKMDYVGREINKAEDPSWIVFPWEQWWHSAS